MTGSTGKKARKFFHSHTPEHKLLHPLSSRPEVSERALKLAHAHQAILVAVESVGDEKTVEIRENCMCHFWIWAGVDDV